MGVFPIFLHIDRLCLNILDGKCPAMVELWRKCGVFTEYLSAKKQYLNRMKCCHLQQRDAQQTQLNKTSTLWCHSFGDSKEADLTDIESGSIPETRVRQRKVRYAVEIGKIVQRYPNVGHATSSILLYSEMIAVNRIVLHMFLPFERKDKWSEG